MDHKLTGLFRRTLSALCAAAVLLGAGSPAALAAGDGIQTQPGDTLSSADAAQMAEADAAVTALVSSDEYAAMALSERQAAAEAELNALVEQGLVEKDSLHYDEENGMYSFTYSCGALGGVLLYDWQDTDEVDVPLPLLLPEEENGADEQNEQLSLGSAIIYYAFDDTNDSTRYPYYTFMQESWNERGLATYLNTNVRVSDLKHMDRYDLCVLSAHGAYYTYTTGWLFKRVRTAPIVILLEESSFWNDLRYGVELLTHQVIKVNGMYCVTPDFFRAAYSEDQLEGTMIFSETCEFFGGSNILDTSLSEALLDRGADVVAGFLNNVYAIYSRNVLWSTVNQLIMGKNILQSVDYALSVHGADDVEWYYQQGGRSPHRYAAYAVVQGDGGATLYSLNGGAADTAA